VISVGQQKRLECRIVLTHGHRVDLKTEVGMWDPLNERYAPLGVHGPNLREIDKMVYGLKDKIEKEGHVVTFSELRGPR
jgi:hypothetical protein